MTEFSKDRLAEIFPNDVARMRRCLQRAGRQFSDAEIIQAWSRYSEDLCANWLRTPEDDAMILHILFDCQKVVSNAKVNRWSATLKSGDDLPSADSLELPRGLMKYIGWQEGMTLDIFHGEHQQLIIRPSTKK